MDALARPRSVLQHRAPGAIARANHEDGRSTVLVLKTSPRAESRSARAADTLAARLEAGGLRVEVAEQRMLPLVAAGLERDDYPAAIRELAGQADRAAAIVVAAPVHRGAISGVARNLLELLRDGLAGKPALGIVAAGSARAHLVGNTLRSDLFLNFDAMSHRPIIVTPQDEPTALEARIEAAAIALLDACLVA